MGKTRLFGLLLLGVLIGGLTIQTGWAEVTHLSFWTVWGVDKASHKALSALVEEFNAQNPDIFVEIVRTAANEEKLVVALLGGTPPDLVTVDFNATGRFEEFMVPLDSLGIRDDFDPNDIFPGIIDRYFNPEGIWYTMPLHIDCQVLLINAEKADAAGLPVFDPPENWYEFEDWGLKMTDKSRWQWGAALSFVFRDQPRSLLWRWTPHLWGCQHISGHSVKRHPSQPSRCRGSTIR